MFRLGKVTLKKYLRKNSRKFLRCKRVDYNPVYEEEKFTYSREKNCDFLK